MKLTELRYIVALAQEGSFSQAARVCQVSQPSLSVAIANLENEFRVPLFERAKGRVTPTQVGEQVVMQARKALAEVEQVKTIALRGTSQLEGEFRLGVIHTIGPYLLPQLVPELTRLAPAMPLFIEENTTANLTVLLSEGQIDAAVIALPFDMPGIVCRPLYEEKFQVVVPIGHPWTERESVTPEELAGDNVLLLKAGNCFRDQVLGACPQISVPDSELRMGFSIGTIRCMVASGLGVSVLPQGALGKPYSSEPIHVIPFADPAPSRRVALAWRATFPRPKTIDALIAGVKSLRIDAYRMLD